MAGDPVKQTQVTSITATIGTSAAPGQYLRVRGFSILTSGTAGGDISIRDLSGGTERVRESVPTATNTWLYFQLPDDGVRFENGCFVSNTAVCKMGVYWS